MGFFDSLKKAFDAGGIGVKLAAPKDFRWQDATLPVTVTLTGHKSEPRTVASLDFRFEDDTDSGASGTRGSGSARSRSGSSVDLRWSHAGPIELLPGQIVSIDIRMPLSKDSASGASGVLDAALSAIASLGEITMRIPWYTLSVHADVVGANLSKGASKRIRNSGGVRFGATGFNVSMG